MSGVNAHPLWRSEISVGMVTLFVPNTCVIDTPVCEGLGNFLPDTMHDKYEQLVVPYCCFDLEPALTISTSMNFGAFQSYCIQ